MPNPTRGPSALVTLDVESDGFHGDPFAWGGRVLPRGHDHTVMPLSVRNRDAVITDPWVRANVLPVMHCEAEVRGVYPMLDAFARWSRAALEAFPGAWLVVDCGYPVDTGLLRACALAGIELPQRAVYPVHELATMLEMAGIPFDVKARVLLRECYGIPEHDPGSDAEAAALLGRHALRVAGLWS